MAPLTIQNGVHLHKKGHYVQLETPQRNGLDTSLLIILNNCRWSLVGVLYIAVIGRFNVIAVRIGFTKYIYCVCQVQP